LSFSPTNHAGAHDLTAVGYDETGAITVYKAWDQKVD